MIKSPSLHLSHMLYVTLLTLLGSVFFGRTPALAQTYNLGTVLDPNSPSHDPAWTANEPDGTNGDRLINTFNAADFSADSSAAHLAVSGSLGFYGNGVKQTNLFNLQLSNVALPANWSIQTTFTTNFSGAEGYPEAGLTVFADTENAVQLTLGNGTGFNYFGVEFAQNGVYTNDSSIFQGGFTPSNNATLWAVRISKNAASNSIDFFYGPNGIANNLLGTVSSSSTGTYAQLYNFLNDIGDKRAGILANDNGSTAQGLVANFSTFGVSASAPEPASVTLLIPIGLSRLLVIARRRRFGAVAVASPSTI